MSKKKKTFVTPVTECRYPFLDKPDTRFDKDGVYRIQLVFEKDDDFIEKVKKASLREFEKAKESMKPKDAATLKYHCPAKPIINDDGDDTGQVELSFKSKASFTDHKTGERRAIKVPVFDAKGKPLKVIPRIGNGSKVSIAFNVAPHVVTGTFYYTTYLNAVQIVELLEFNPDGTSYGFGKHTEGFDVNDIEEKEPEFDKEPGSHEDDDDSPF